MKNTITFLFLFATVNSFAQLDPDTKQDPVKANHVVTKRVLIEEGTGTWCVACPWGIVRMEEMSKKYPSTAALVAVHFNDPMKEAAYETGIAPKFSGVPNALIDRQGKAVDPDQIEAAYLERIKHVPAIDVFIDKVSYIPSTRLLSFNVNATTVAAFNGSYRFNAVIAEMHVHGKTKDYDQYNTFNGGGMGPMGGFENKPNPVPAADMYYDFVGRTILGGWSGTPNSIPATNASGQTISHTYTKIIPVEWNEKNLSLIGFVINSTDGSVENVSLPAKLQSVITGIHVNEKVELVAYPNPTSGVVWIRNAEGMDITVLDMAGMQVLKTEKNVSQIDLSKLSNGVYFLQFNSASETYTKKFVLMK